MAQAHTRAVRGVIQSVTFLETILFVSHQSGLFAFANANECIILFSILIRVSADIYGCVACVEQSVAFQSIKIR